jgi:hypothetical protein
MVPALYQKYFIDTSIERLSLFKNFKTRYLCETVLYPGSFVHIAPSFYFPEVVYLDVDKRCRKFFSDPGTLGFINSKKEYKQAPALRFHEMSYENGINEMDDYFDLLISQYAGFISKYCTRYLKKNGFLLVNDSHGDATLAMHSGEYELVGIVDGEMNISADNLDQYFTFTRKKDLDIENILRTMKGPKYRRMADSYIFKKSGPGS